MSDITPSDAPGRPGIAPTWSSSAKQMVGCAIGPSRLWFTLGGGIVNEVYYPRIDIPQIRDLGFLVGDGRDFWVEVKRLDHHRIALPAPGIPAVHVEHHHERFDLSLRITPHPATDVLLLEITLEGDKGLRPYALVAPHLGGTGNDNRAEVARYRGRRILWAEQGPFALALAAVDDGQRDVMGRASAGYVGFSDGWQDFTRHGAMTWEWERAGPGNVALMGELPRRAVLGLGFGSSRESAATLVLSALTQPFEQAWEQQVTDWKQWHATRISCGCDLQDDWPRPLRDQFATSAMVLKAHQDKTFPGAMVASLSVPWGNTRDERGGYHLVWPRDLVECAGALLTLGAHDDARGILRYLIASQCEDGHWHQNQWLGGKAYWTGIQLDEAAFPVLLAAALAERDALDGVETGDMVRRALAFIARNGPASDQDRWEEDAGVNPFTLAICIAALVAGARFLEPAASDLALAIADYWNAHTEAWTAVFDSAFARRLGVRGYYLREAPPQAITDEQALHSTLPIKNRVCDPALPADEQIAVDFLQLVRFGLRRADDPLVRDSLKAADALLKVDTPAGPSWHRYNGDGYGEHADGSAFDGTGQGRAWPLLTGERGHYAVAAGADPMPFLKAMSAMAGSGGMLPEQIWDAPALPERGLYPGRPTGSAMPLVWAHAEFIKLAVSSRLGRPFDRPDAVWRRYGGKRPSPDYSIWSESAPVRHLLAGTPLYVCLTEAAVVHWGIDGWQGVQDTPTRDTGLGLHVAELPTAALHPGQGVDFTYRRTATGAWAGTDYRVAVIRTAVQGGHRKSAKPLEETA